MGFFRKTLENRDINGYTNDEFLRLLGINDISIDRDKLGEITYFTCLKLLSESLAKLPLKLYKETNNGTKKATNHYLYAKLKIRPNPYQSSWNFWSTVEFNRNHYGNCFVYMDTVKGKVHGLYILPNDKVKIWIDNAGLISNDNAIWYIYEDNDKKEHKINHEQILHFKTSISLNGITGLAVQDILRINIENAQSGQKFVNNYFKNGMFAKGLLQFTGDIAEDKIRLMQSKFETMANGIANAGRILPVPLGFSFTTLDNKLTDSQFLELNKYTSLQIAGAFGIKPEQINDLTQAKFNNVELQQRSFYIDTLLSILTQYEQELTYKLLTSREREQNYFFKFNVDSILRADFKTRFEGYAQAIQNGILTPNEARELEDKSTLKDGDQLIVNGNYIPLSMVGQQYVNSSEGGDDKDEGARN